MHPYSSFFDLAPGTRVVNLIGKVQLPSGESESPDFGNVFENEHLADGIVEVWSELDGQLRLVFNASESEVIEPGASADFFDPTDRAPGEDLGDWQFVEKMPVAEYQQRHREPAELPAYFYL